MQEIKKNFTVRRSEAARRDDVEEPQGICATGPKMDLDWLKIYRKRVEASEGKFERRQMIPNSRIGIAVTLARLGHEPRRRGFTIAS